VAACLAKISGTPLKTFWVEFADDTRKLVLSRVFNAGGSRRRIRVGWLRLARWTVISAALLYLIFKWEDLTHRLPALKLANDFLRSSSLTSWMVLPLSDWATRASGIAVVASVAFLTYGLLSVAWGHWDSSEGRNFSGNRTPSTWALFLWVSLLVLAFSLPGLIEETTWYIKGEPHPLSNGEFLILWCTPIFFGLLLWMAVSSGWLPGAPDGENDKRQSEMTASKGKNQQLRKSR
jgi:hypothetical protein